MKLNRHTFNLLIIANLIICYLTQIHLAAKIDSPFHKMHRYLQKSTSLSSEKKLLYGNFKVLDMKKSNQKYAVKLYTIKETDAIGAAYTPFLCQVNFDKNINIFKNNNALTTTLKFNDFMFLDGVILFDELSFFLKVKTLDYQDIMNKFRPRIERFAEIYGIQKFNKYCFFSINNAWKDSDNKNKGKEFSSYVFCLPEESADEETLKKFPEDFRQNYSRAIVETKDLLDLQQYRLKQNIQIQYYEPHITLADIQSQSSSTGQSLLNGKLPTYYSSFSKEGLVMNLDSTHNPLKVKYSFRFDQVIKCRGGNPKDMKKYLRPQITSLFKPDYCCVSYLVDQENTCNMAMFCSTYNKDWKCKADIEIFKSTLYKRCMIGHIENIDKKIAKVLEDKNNSQISFLRKATLIYALRETMDPNILNNVQPDSSIATSFKKIIPKNKEYEAKVIKTLEPDCAELLKHDQDREIRKAKKKKVVLGGVDLGAGVEDDLQYSYGLMSAKKIKQLRKDLCQDYLKVKNEQTNQNLLIPPASTQTNSNSSLNQIYLSKLNAEEIDLNTNIIPFVSNNSQANYNPAGSKVSTNNPSENPLSGADENRGNKLIPQINNYSTQNGQLSQLKNIKNSNGNLISTPTTLSEEIKNNLIPNNSLDQVNIYNLNKPGYNSLLGSPQNLNNSELRSGVDSSKNVGVPKYPSLKLNDPFMTNVGNKGSNQQSTDLHPNNIHAENTKSPIENTLNNSEKLASSNGKVALIPHTKENPEVPNINKIMNNKNVRDSLSGINNNPQLDNLGNPLNNDPNDHIDNSSDKSPLKSFSKKSSNTKNPFLKINNQAKLNSLSGNTSVTPISKKKLDKIKLENSKKENFYKEMQNIKEQLKKSNLDPKLYDKLENIINNYPDIKNTFMNSPDALKISPKDAMDIFESTPQDAVRKLRKLSKEKSLLLYKDKLFKNKFNIKPQANLHSSNKNSKTSNDVNNLSGGQSSDDNLKEVNALAKDQFGNIIKIDKTSTKNLQLPFSNASQYIDEDDTPINKNIKMNDEKRKINVPEFHHASDTSNGQKSIESSYKNPLDDPESIKNKEEDMFGLSNESDVGNSIVAPTKLANKNNKGDLSTISFPFDNNKEKINGIQKRNNDLSNDKLGLDVEKPLKIKLKNMNKQIESSNPHSSRENNGQFSEELNKLQKLGSGLNNDPESLKIEKTLKDDIVKDIYKNNDLSGMSSPLDNSRELLLENNKPKKLKENLGSNTKNIEKFINKKDLKNKINSDIKAKPSIDEDKGFSKKADIIMKKSKGKKNGSNPKVAETKLKNNNTSDINLRQENKSNSNSNNPQNSNLNSKNDKKAAISDNIISNLKNELNNLKIDMKIPSDDISINKEDAATSKYKEINSKVDTKTTNNNESINKEDVKSNNKEIISDLNIESNKSTSEKLVPKANVNEDKDNSQIRNKLADPDINQKMAKNGNNVVNDPELKPIENNKQSDSGKIQNNKNTDQKNSVDDSKFLGNNNLGKKVKNMKNSPNSTSSKSITRKGKEKDISNNKDKLPVYSVAIGNSDHKIPPTSKGFIERNKLFPEDSNKLIKIIDQINLEGR